MAVVRFNLADFKAATERAINAGVGAAAMQGAKQMRGILGRESRLQGSAAGRPPNSQTGRLMRSLTSTPGVNRRAAAGTNVKYAPILERGGVIRAKRSKFLAVPINPAAKRESERGIPLRAKERQVIRTTTGKLLLIAKDKVKGSVTRGSKGTFRFNHEPVHLLVKSVTIRPHPFIRPAVFGPGKKSPTMRAAVAAATRAMGKFAKAGVMGGSIA